MNIFAEIFGAFNVLGQILPVVMTAVQTVQADTGKPWDQVAEDVINHLTADKPNAPSLNG